MTEEDINVVGLIEVELKDSKNRIYKKKGTASLYKYLNKNQWAIITAA